MGIALTNYRTYCCTTDFSDEIGYFDYGEVVETWTYKLHIIL